MGVKHRRGSRSWRELLNPVVALRTWVTWFERRGVYGPGDEGHPLSAWRDFGWWIAAWLITVSVFVIFFAATG